MRIHAPLAFVAAAGPDARSRRASLGACLLVAVLFSVSCAGPSEHSRAGGVQLLTPDLHSRVAAPVLATVTTPDAVRLRVTLVAPEGPPRVLADVDAPESPESRVATLDLRGAGAGTYRLRAEVLGTDGEPLAEREYRFTRRLNGTPRVGFDENNAMVRAGRPFFPVGLWLPHFETGTPMGLEHYAGSGVVNTALIQGSRSDDGDEPERFSRMLRRSREIGVAGVGLARGGRYELDVKRVVEAAKDEPSLLAWMWIDEPEYNDVSPAQARAWTEDAHETDPHHPVLINLAGSQFVGQGGTEAAARRFTKDLIDAEKPLPADWISTDYYPIAFSQSFSTSLQVSFDNFAEHLSTVREWTRDLYPLSTFIETSSLPGLGSQAVPTPEQVWAQTWIAVARGARGITWFQHGETDPGTPATQRKARRYLERFAPVLAEPDSTRVRRSHIRGSRVDMVAKEHGGRIYIFSVNRDVSAEAKVRFELPGGIGDSVTLYGEDRTIPLSAPFFEDTFAPYAVHIYVVTAPP